MPIRMCFFDINRTVIDMLYSDHPKKEEIYANKTKDVMICKTNECWICSLIGENAAFNLPEHQKDRDVCKAKAIDTSEEKMSELWVIHGHEPHRSWLSSIESIDVTSPPLAFLFVSFGGKANFFAEETKVVNLKLKGQDAPAQVPVFHYQDGIASKRELFTDLLSQFVVALDGLQNQDGGDPLELFKKAAQDATNSEWPQKVGLRDNAKYLFYLYAACKLSEQEPLLTKIVMGLLSNPVLKIAKGINDRSSDELVKYLEQLHKNLLIPLECWAELMKWEHNSDKKEASLTRDQILKKKRELVNKWFRDNKDTWCAFSKGEKLQEHWATLKELSEADVDKWDSTVR
jgi:hypothetical protein